MSALGGILYAERDRHVRNEEIARLNYSLGYLGPDGGQTYTSGPLGLVFRSFHTTCESRRVPQPFFGDGVAVVFDGRIDNGRELSKQLAGISSSASDVQIFAAAYETWGKDCFVRILGDFAAAIWDNTIRELLLVRDPFGVKKLVYSHSPEKIVWASDSAALLDSFDVPDDVDEDFIGLYLSFLPDGSNSPFKQVVPVKPGNYVAVKNNSLSTHEYWKISDHLKVTPGTRPLIEEEFRSLLFTAVAACMRAEGPVSAELSGGLDSSTIVCVADVLSRESEGSMPSISTISHVYNAARNADERDFISVVEKHRGVAGTHLVEDSDPILSRWPDPEFISFPNRDHCFGGMTDMTLAAMREHGSRILLSGLFGDQLLISSHLLPYEAADLVHTREFGKAFRTCYEWSLRNRQPVLPVWWHAGMRPNLPSWMRRADMFSGRGRRTSISQFSIPTWIDSGFARRTRLRQRVHRLLDGKIQFGAGTRGLRYANLMECVGYFGSGFGENQTTTSCIEMRYPFLYRPLVEFLLSLPYSELGNVHSVRYLQRTALRGILPDKVRLRTDKKGPTEAVFRAVAREWDMVSGLVRESRACERGFVSRNAILAEAERCRNGDQLSDLLKFVALEMWLRALERRKRPTLGA